MIVFRCFVPGDPRPKGSKTSFPIRRKTGKMGVVLTESSDKTGKLKTWRARLAEAIQRAALESQETSGVPLPLGVMRGKERLPVAVALVFGVARPASAPKYRVYPTTKPDLDKLERTVLDELSGVVFLDDTQICEQHNYEKYAEQPGVAIEVWVL